MIALSSIASQIYINMFVDGFIVALSVVMMGYFLYIFKDLKPTAACMLIGIFSPLFRLVIVLLQGGEFAHSMILVLPDMAFFFTYAFIFGIMLRKLGYSTHGNYYVRLLISDFISNCAEFLVRFLISDIHIGFSQIKALLILAIFRSFFIILICLASDFYTSLLARSGHEDNYRKLALMASTFKSEVYFMEKNMNEIEEIMKNAFTLYKKLAEESYPQNLQRIALEIAKDIHEVKKGYKRVIIGLQDNFLNEISYAPLKLTEILKILSTHISNNVASRKLDLSFYYKVQTDFIVNNHFALMSILRNLVSNSMDALEESDIEKGIIKIFSSEIEKDGKKYYRISVSDNGPGIDEKFIDVIFETGFSTKYNKQTGDINRGLGLTLVHDLTVDTFNGQIDVISNKVGTSFILDFPSEVFYVENED